MTKRPVTREASLRRDVVDSARAMSASGLSPGRSGNVSARFDDGMLITPSGLAYDLMQPDDIVHVCADGRVRSGQRAPSTEWHFHQAAYAKRPDMHALVHSHSMNATVLACAVKTIPAFHYMVAVAGGSDIPVVPYATFGTVELAHYVADGLAERNACLMAHHGQVAMGATLSQALELAHEVEVLAEQYAKLLTLGPVKLLSQADMALVLEKFKSYGRSSANE